MTHEENDVMTHEENDVNATASRT